MTGTQKVCNESTGRRAVKNFGLALFRGLGAVLPHGGVPVLGYHSVDNSGSHISIAPAMLDAQMRELKAAGCRGVSLRELLDAEARALSKRVALTFDDGLQNFFDEAVPVLQRYGFTATLFVPTDCVGKTAEWYPEYGLPALPALGWDGLKACLDAGMDVQSHGVSHRRLSELSAGELAHEAETSKQLIEQNLSRDVTLFCYPFGDVNDACAASVRRAGYDAAVTVKQGLYRPGRDDVYRIPREILDYISIHSDCTARLSMRACLNGGFARYVNARLRVRRNTGTGS